VLVAFLNRHQNIKEPLPQERTGAGAQRNQLDALAPSGVTDVREFWQRLRPEHIIDVKNVDFENKKRCLKNVSEHVKCECLCH